VVVCDAGDAQPRTPDATRVQVLSADGAPLQLLSFGRTLRSLCSDGNFVWVRDGRRRVQTPARNHTSP